VLSTLPGYSSKRYKVVRVLLNPFLRVSDRVFETYRPTGRSVETMVTSYALFGLTVYGRPGGVGRLVRGLAAAVRGARLRFIHLSLCSFTLRLFEHHTSGDWHCLGVADHIKPGKDHQSYLACIFNIIDPSSLATTDSASV
jgi:hypothetical protein